MNQFEVQRRLRQQAVFLNQKFKVKRLGIFGSYARNEATEGSDIDVLVEFSEPIGWEFIDLHEYLETLLGKKVDLVTINALKPQLKNSILSQVIYV